MKMFIFGAIAGIVADRLIANFIFERMIGRLFGWRL